MSKLVLAAAGGLFLAAPVLAQESYQSTAIGLGFGQVSLQDEDASGVSLDLEHGMRSGNLELDLALGVNQLSDDGDDATHFGVDVTPTYWFTNSFGGGIYLAKDQIEFNDDFEIDALSYGLEGKVTGNGITGGLFFGETDLENAGTMNDVGLTVQADLSHMFSLWGSHVRSRPDGAGADSDVHSTTIGGSVLMDNGFGTFASYQSMSVDGTTGSANVASLGLSYTADLGGQGVMFSGEYANATGNSDFAFADGDRLSLGATILLGDAQRKRVPANSVASSSLDVHRNGVTSLLGATGF
ncbi:hypothetical protein [Sagittula sp. SSi028]|uniref:hypothetical protein n=1 Tax=Sagittula sp. SSi028 TaxID=3400636 RepID=UPI003AF77818